MIKSIICRKRRNYLFFIPFLLYPCICLLTASTGTAESRGINVKISGTGGSAQKIHLYSSYYALVVGCSKYTNGWPDLPNPVSDAREVSQALRGLGFQIRLVENPSSRELRRALNRLMVDVGREPERAIIVYFAGHGHTVNRADGKKLGFIVPVDAPNPDVDLLGFMELAISMQEIEQLSALIHSKHVLMFFDSCFSGALFSVSRANPPRYIAEQVSKPVRQFITAGSENEEVPDQSIFKICLLQAILDRHADFNDDGYITGQELGSYLQQKVVNYTDGGQHPQYGKINNPRLDKGDFVFVYQNTGEAKQNIWSLENETRKKLMHSGQISLDVGFFFEGQGGKPYPMRNGIKLSANDNYAVYFKPKQNCHVYVIQQDASGKFYCLFPNPDYGTETNPAKNGNGYWVPSRDTWFYLDNFKGKEWIYLVATKTQSETIIQFIEAINEGNIKEPTLSKAITKMGPAGVRRSAFEAVTVPGKDKMDLIIEKTLSDGAGFVHSIWFNHQ